MAVSFAKKMKLHLTLAVFIVCFAVSLAADATSHNKKHHNKKHVKKHGTNAKREMTNEESQDNNDFVQLNDESSNPDDDGTGDSCTCICDDSTDPTPQAKRHKKHKKHVAKRDADEPVFDPNAECPMGCYLECELPEASGEQEGVEDAKKKKKHAGLKRHNKHH